jgi:hypothetical protein
MEESNDSSANQNDHEKRNDPKAQKWNAVTPSGT